MNQASEQHIGTFLHGGGVTGAPVIELRYKHECNAVPDKVNMVTY
ncbi:hypothetical protein Bmyc01_29530 [Bacillus mycoides]|nr:hypothetical protein Bmyc01_29530 [Bacillus mycoides]